MCSTFLVEIEGDAREYGRFLAVVSVSFFAVARWSFHSVDDIRVYGLFVNTEH